jgi:hypothetical protein
LAVKDIKEVTALVFDHGLFIPLAHALAKGCKRVLYHTPAERAFNRVNEWVVGDGFEDIELCEDIWDVRNEVDLWVFPDIQHSGLQNELHRQGCAVWGSRSGDSIEIQRVKFHKLLGKLGLEVPPYVTKKGWTALREHLRHEENKYIKISKYRGNLETCHWRNWELDEDTLNSWAVEFGPVKEQIMFLVFDDIKTDLEIGGDTYCVQGKWPAVMLHGDERKDECYFGAVTEFGEMPEALQDVMDAFSPVLAEEGYCNQWSMEVRVKDDKSYFIDPTCRGGLPSTGSQIVLWKNLPEIIWAGANGELVNPEVAEKDKFSAECLLTMKREEGGWAKTRIPEELKDAMLVRNCCAVDGAVAFPPNDIKGDEIGWLVAKGSTMEETVERMLEYKKLVPSGVVAHTEGLADVIKEIQAAEEKGIEFTDQEIPEPAIVVES